MIVPAFFISCGTLLSRTNDTMSILGSSYHSLFFTGRTLRIKDLYSSLEQALKGYNPLCNREFTCFLLSSCLRTLFYLLVQRYKVLFFTRNRKPDFLTLKG